MKFPNKKSSSWICCIFSLSEQDPYPLVGVPLWKQAGDQVRGQHVRVSVKDRPTQSQGPKNQEHLNLKKNKFLNNMDGVVKGLAKDPVINHAAILPRLRIMLD